MSQLESWRCDCCGKIFTEKYIEKDSTELQDPLFLNSGSLDLCFDAVNQYYPELKLEFSDLCLTCRGKLIDKINEALEELESNEWLVN